MKPKLPHRNPRSRLHAPTESSSTSTQHEAPRAAPPPDQYGSYYFGIFINPVIFTQASHYTPPYLVSTPYASMFFAPTPSPTPYYTLIPTTTLTYLPPTSLTPYYTPMLTTPTYPPPPTILTYYPQPSYATPYIYPLIIS